MRAKGEVMKIGKHRPVEYQNAACALCGGIEFNVKTAIWHKKLVLVCTGCMKKTFFNYR